MGNKALPLSSISIVGKYINKILQHVVSVLSAVKHLDILGVGESHFSLTTDNGNAPGYQRRRMDWEVAYR